MSTGYSLRKVVLKSALPGIVTGCSWPSPSACGETAPLIYTAGWTGRRPNLQLTGSHGFAYLTYPIFTFYNQPGQASPRSGI